MSKPLQRFAAGRKSPEQFRDLSHRIVRHSGYHATQTEFLRKILQTLLDFSGCDSVGLRWKGSGGQFQCEAVGGAEASFSFRQDDSAGDQLCRTILWEHFDPASPNFTKNGSFWTGNTAEPLRLGSPEGGPAPGRLLRIGGDHKSIALVPIEAGEDGAGTLELKSKHQGFFFREEVELYEHAAQTIGSALISQRAQSALRERVKELACLYDIAQIAGQPGKSLKEILQSIVEILPPAWQYPEIAVGRIILDGATHGTAGFPEGAQKQTADVIIHGERRGTVEIAYQEPKTEMDEGPFLKEERSLIGTVARQVALIAEQKLAEEERLRLREQLRHADRLATIGQLAAGIAHELNEPLGNILGFAQLVKKTARLPKQALSDVDKIEAASLYAREVIKKLLIFARQMPARKIPVDLNQVLEEGLYFFKMRCAKEGVELVTELAPGLPQVLGDPTQLRQVLVNLVVNALQAMSGGGRLEVRTESGKDQVWLMVQDTGTGMSEKVKKQIFTPFFTTKDVGEGTGLGLAVVYGIVKSHKGSIQFDSEVGRGTRFRIQLPAANPRETRKGR